MISLWQKYHTNLHKKIEKSHITKGKCVAIKKKEVQARSNRKKPAMIFRTVSNLL